jgi:hypothetical protein
MKNFNEIRNDLLSKLEFHKLNTALDKSTMQNIRIAAVDSSSATILDAGCFIIIAYRAGAITTLGGKISSSDQFTELPEQLALVNTSESNIEKNLRRFLNPLIEAMKDLDRGPKPPDADSETPASLLKLPHPRDIDWQQLARAVEEWQQVRALLDELKPGDYILRDGPLSADIRVPPGLVDGILKEAAAREIHVIGIVKRSSIPVGPPQLMPIVPAIQKLGAAEFPTSSWYSPLPPDISEASKYPYNFGESYIVQYHPLSQFVFLTDTNIYDKIPPKQVFEQLGAICSDPVYIGYPYPLALIHNQVVLTRAKAEDIRNNLQSKAFEANTISVSDWEALFKNFHDILDINVY